MHFVSKIDPSTAQTPQGYEQSSSGFRRSTYVERTMGSVHMGAGICYLDSTGVIQPHLHSFEESFYVLEGRLIVQIGEQSYVLESGNFGLISTGVPHSWRNIGEGPARWLEMHAPQPRSLDYGRDTFFIGSGDVIWTGVGCIHSFSNIGTEPVRWIETQAPLPPAKEIFRFERDWTQYAANEPVV